MSATVHHRTAYCAARPHRGVAPTEQLRLTRRGRLVLSLASLVTVAAAFVGLAAPVIADQPGGPPPATRSVVVGPGDTLWEIARESVPQADTRDVVAQIRRLNGLSSGSIAVGDELEVPTR